MYRKLEKLKSFVSPTQLPRKKANCIGMPNFPILTLEDTEPKEI